MNYLLLLVLFVTVFQISFAFLGSSHMMNKLAQRSNKLSMSSPSTNTKKTTVVAGEDLPEELVGRKCLYDMILVERFAPPEKTKSGLYLPAANESMGKNLAKVVAMPESYGVETVQGNVVPIEVLAPFKVGDVVYVKDQWGKGPMDLNVKNRQFSFMRSVNIYGFASEPKSEHESSE